MENGVLWKKRDTAGDAWRDIGKLALISWMMYVRGLSIPDNLPTFWKGLATVNSYFVTSIAIFLSFLLALEVTKRVWEADK